MEYIRNAIGSHWNASQLLQISRSEIVEFAEKVLELHDVFWCVDCDTFISYIERERRAYCPVEHIVFPQIELES